jgi:hypothetical protein
MNSQQTAKAFWDASSQVLREVGSSLRAHGETCGQDLPPPRSVLEGGRAYIVQLCGGCGAEIRLEMPVVYPETMRAWLLPPQ